MAKKQNFTLFDTLAEEERTPKTSSTKEFTKKLLTEDSTPEAPKKPIRVKTSFRIPSDLLEAYKDKALASGYSVNELLVMAMRLALEQGFIKKK